MMGEKIIRYGLIFFLCCSCVLSPRSDKKEFYLFGEVEAEDGTKIYLKSQEFYEIIPIDSTTVENSQFSFSGKLTRPVIYGFYIEHVPGVLGVFMESDSISIALNPKDLANSTVVGSATNAAYHAFLTQSYQISAKIDQLYPLFQKARSEDNLKKLKDINDRMQAIYHESTNFALSYAEKNPTSYIAAYALHSVLNTKDLNVETVKMIYDNFSIWVKKGDFSLEILHYITERESVR